MNAPIRDIIEAIKNRENHFFIISGNVYDSISYGPQRFGDVIEFLISLTEKKFPQLITYDLFSGVRVVRGDEEEILTSMGLAEEKPPEDKKSKNSETAEMVKALKEAKKEGNSKFPINPLELFPCFDKLFNASAKQTVVLIDYADALVPAGLQNQNRQAERVSGIAFTKWSRSSAVRQKGHLIILVCRRATDLDEGLLDRSFDTLQFRMPKPDEEERAEVISKKGMNPSFVPVLGKATSGLSFREIEKIADRCASMSELDEMLQYVFGVKQKFLSDEYADLMDIMKTRNGFESIGGLEKPIAKLRRIARAMREGKTTLVPQGILFMGPPGTGKTILAEAFAKEAGLNFVKPKDIKIMWLGESERRMTRLLDALRDLSPVVAFIDEFDQNQSQRGGFDGDSGTSRSLFKKMLEVMSDTSLRGKILWIFATNRPDLIDPAMKRAGRCDLRIPFLPADENQLVLICNAAFMQYPEMRSSVSDWLPYAKLCKGYSGSDMVEVVRRAWDFANENNRDQIIEEDMEWACHDYKPQVLDRREAIRMALLSLVECSSLSLLPDNWQELTEQYKKELEGNGTTPDSDESLGELLRKTPRK